RVPMADSFRYGDDRPRGAEKKRAANIKPQLDVELPIKRYSPRRRRQWHRRRLELFLRCSRRLSATPHSEPRFANLVEFHNLRRAAYFVEMGPICSLVTCPFFLLLASLRQAAVALAVVSGASEDASRASLEGILDKHGPTGWYP